jgi:hypothetical protein
MLTNPTYADIKSLLDKSIGGPGENIGAHGPFWRTRTRDQFIVFTYKGEVLIASDGSGGFDADASNLVKALKGQAPFGDDLNPPVPGARFPRMPYGMDPMPDDDILTIRQWISLGCPA